MRVAAVALLLLVLPAAQGQLDGDVEAIRGSERQDLALAGRHLKTFWWLVKPPPRPATSLLPPSPPPPPVRSPSPPRSARSPRPPPPPPAPRPPPPPPAPRPPPPPPPPAPQTASTASSASARILAVGDSLTAGVYGANKSGYLYWPYSIELSELLQEAGINAVVQQQGVAGEVISQISARLTKYISYAETQGFTYNWVLIMGGINDIVKLSANASDIIDGLLGMYEQSWASGAKVFAMTLMEIASKYNEANRVAVNAWLRSYAALPAQQGRMLLLDTDKLIPWFNATAIQKERRLSDGVHLTIAGYNYEGTQIFNALAPKLKAFVSRRKLHSAA